MKLLLLNAWFALLLVLVHLQSRVQMQLELRVAAKRYQLAVARRRTPHPPVHVRWRRARPAALPPHEVLTAAPASTGPAPIGPLPTVDPVGVEEREELQAHLAGRIRSAVRRNQLSARRVEGDRLN